MISIENPQLELNLVVSTAHITESDSKIFQNNSDLPVFNDDYLHRVNMPSYDCARHDVIKAGISGACIDILDYASEKKYTNVVFDCDGPKYDLPEFNW